MKIPDLQLYAFGPELAVAVGVLVVLLAAAFDLRTRTTSIMGMITLGVALVWWWRLPVSSWAFAGDYAGDGVSYFARGFFIIVAIILTVIISRGGALRHKNENEFLALLYISILGMMVMASAKNWIVIFLGLETMSIPLYVMAAFFRTQRGSVEAGVKYFIYGAFASAFLVYGLALVFASTGTLDHILLKESGPFDRLAIAGLGLILTGLAFKVAAVPFHMWAPDAYSGAPTVVTAFFAVAPKAAGFVALLRLVELGTVAGGPEVESIIVGLAVLSIIMGNLWALVQTQLKRMLAYSSIAHGGYLLLALVAIRTGGVEAMMTYLVAYGLMTMGSFIVLLALENDGPADTYNDISGSAYRRPILALAMTIFMVSLSGIPVTFGFIGKLQIFKALMRSDHVGLVIVAVAGSLISVAYYLRVVVYMYMRSETNVERAPLPAGWALICVALALGVVVLGIFPDLILPTLAEWSNISSSGAVWAVP